ncbi:hypothetical protein ABT167_37335 [Streptomyces sp. NPDC001792]|uniref:hypothetical protein n=1 Tax=Streptomyces sp. NPDC001792 TaxID=3154524 RepID=UPI003320F096
MSSAHHPATHESPRFRAFLPRDLDRLLQRVSVPTDQRLVLRALSVVLRALSVVLLFRANAHVVDGLKGWSAAAADRLEPSDRGAL